MYALCNPEGLHVNESKVSPLFVTHSHLEHTHHSLIHRNILILTLDFRKYLTRGLLLLLGITENLPLF